MKKLGFTLAAVVLALAALPARAQSMTVGGAVAPGASGTGFAEALENSWNDGTDFDCRTGSPTLIVTAQTGNCAWREVSAFFEVTSGGGTTVDPHTFSYNVFCDDSGFPVVRHLIGFDGDTPISIDSGVFNFNLSGGDTLRITTTEGAATMPAVSAPEDMSVPALGEWGAIVVGVGLALLAIVLILRRQANPAG